MTPIPKRHTPCVIMFRAWSIVLLGLVVTASRLAAADSDPPGAPTGEAIRLDAQVLVYPQGGVVEIAAQGRRQWFSASIKDNDGWAVPGTPLGPPNTFQTADTTVVRLDYAIPGDRQFHLTVTTLNGTLGALVEGKLENRGRSPVVEYTFWSWASTNPGIVTPAGTKVANPQEWTPFEPSPWKYVLADQGDAGWALVTEGVVGRSPGTTSAMGYLHPLERFQEIPPGGNYVSRFAAAWVPDAKGAATFAKAIAKFTQGDVDDAVVAYGQPAPSWARTQTAGGYYRPCTGEWTPLWSDEVINKRLKLWPWIIGSTPGPEVLKRMQAAQIPLLHYICFLEMLDTAAQVAGGSKVYPEWYESVLNEGRDLAKHPDWINIDENGKPRRSLFGMMNNHPGLFACCFHQEELHRAIENQVRELMKRGYNGVFVDLAFSASECYGPKFGIHQHAEPAKSNTDKYMEALDLIYRVVKEVGPERLVVLNGVLDSNWPRADALMWEAAIYEPGKDLQVQTKAELIMRGKKYAKAVAAGKILFQLSYRGSTDGNPWQRVLYTYCYARLFGFTWSDYNELYDVDPARAIRLYSLRLGEPLAAAVELPNGVWRRDYAQGIVLWNGDDQPAQVALDAPGKTVLRNVADAATVTGTNGVFPLAMPAHSGLILQSP